MSEERPDHAPAAPAGSSTAGLVGPIGRRNMVWGWCAIVLGPLTGSILMAWTFAGPFSSPVPWLEDYVSVERRMLRLGHVALVMIPLINIVFARAIDSAHLSDAWKNLASWLLIVGLVFVPLGMVLAGAVWVPLKYLSMPGVCAFIAGLAITALGKVREARSMDGGRPRG